MDPQKSSFNRILLIVLAVLFIGSISTVMGLELSANPETPAWWMVALNLLIMAIPFGLIFGSIYILVAGVREYSLFGKINPGLAKIVHWAPRVASMLIILFISLFSLDVFEMQGSPLELLGGFLVHNIPSFILILILIFAWKRPVVGFVAYLVAAVAFVIRFGRPFFEGNLLIFALPILLISGLFLADWRWSRPQPSIQTDPGI